MAKRRMTAEDFDMLRRWFRAGAMTDTALKDVRYRKDTGKRFERIDAWLADQFVKAGGVYPPCGMVEVNQDMARWDRWASVDQDGDDRSRGDLGKADHLPGGIVP